MNAAQCAQFLANQKVNPATGKAIKVGGPTHKKLMAQCEAHRAASPRRASSPKRATSPKRASSPRLSASHIPGATYAGASPIREKLYMFTVYVVGSFDEPIVSIFGDRAHAAIEQAELQRNDPKMAQFYTVTEYAVNEFR